MSLPQCYAIRRGCGPGAQSVPIHRHPAPAATFVGTLPVSRWVLCDAVDAAPSEQWFQLRGCGGFVRRDHLPANVVDTAGPCDQAALELTAADTVLLAVAHSAGAISTGTSGPAVLLGIQQLARYFSFCRRSIQPSRPTLRPRRRQIPTLPVQASIPTLAAAVFTPGSDGSAAASDKLVGIGGCSQVRIGALRQNTVEGREMQRRMSSASEPGTPVAVKVVDVRQAGGFERVAFEAAVGEAVANARASTRLCPSYGVFDAAASSAAGTARRGTTCAIVSPLVDGVPLTELMAQHGPFAEHEALWILREVLLALHELHTNIGVVHGDVKPENVLLTKTGQPVLIDYGCATPVPPVGDGGAMDSGGSLYGPLGTAGFVAPELLCAAAADDGQHERTPKIDVYGCGVLMQDLLSSGDSRLRGTPWFDGIVSEVPAAVDVRGLLLRGLPSATTIALINLLISDDPADRPTVADVLRAPTFGPPTMATWVDWQAWFAACVRDCALLVRLTSDAETVTRLSQAVTASAKHCTPASWPDSASTQVVADASAAGLDGDSGAAAAATVSLLETSNAQPPAEVPQRRARKTVSKAPGASKRPADNRRAPDKLTRSATATGEKAIAGAATGRRPLGAAVRPVHPPKDRTSSVSARPSANESARTFLDRLATPKKLVAGASDLSRPGDRLRPSSAAARPRAAAVDTPASEHKRPLQVTPAAAVDKPKRARPRLAARQA